MSFFIVLFEDGSLKIYKSMQDREFLPEGARQFKCSSNVTVQDLCLWLDGGCKKLRTIKEI